MPKTGEPGAAINKTSRVVAFRLAHPAYEELSRRAAKLGFATLGEYLRDHCEGMAKTGKRRLRKV